ncbi:MAG: aldo/keto reductase [Beijerinckiaceae bacterium]
MSFDPSARRQIGKTKLSVSQLGFGTGPFGNLLEKAEDAMTRAAVAAALDGGISYFDTAPFYGHGLSEHRLGEALRDHDRSRAVVSTKVGRLLRPTRAAVKTPGPFAGTLPFEITFDYSYDGAMRSLEDSLQRMGMTHVDIAIIHDVTAKWRGDQFEASYRQAVEGAYKALDKLRSEGVIGAVGVGINEVDTLERFARDADFDCFMLAGRYTLLDTTALPSLMPVCERKKISILLAAPFHSGILVTGAKPGAKFWYADAPQEVLDRVARIERICAAHRVSLQAAAIQFPLAHPAMGSIAAGYRNPAEVAAALSACRAPVPADFWAELKAEELIDPAAPTPAGD